MHRRFLKIPLALLMVLASACGGESGVADCNVESTFGAIEQLFEARGCTASACHGQPADEAQGRLDLREGFAYESLLEREAQASTMARIFPGDEALSLLYVKLAAKTNGEPLPNGVAGGAMPASGDALTADELALVRLWIRAGASEGGFAADTETLLKCNPTVDADPNKIPPPDPPDPSVAAQLYAGGWELAAESEDEVCFVTYYDYSDRIPSDMQFPCSDDHGGAGRSCFAFKNILLSQDPQSHHSITEMYIPPPSKPEQWDPMGADSGWKNWQCLGGANNGASCDPRVADVCGERSACATEPTTAVACTLYPNGPAELLSLSGFGLDIGFSTRRPITIAQEFIFRESFAEGVFQEMPVEGYLIWNSHAFNLTPKDTTIEQWLTLEFAQPEERLFTRRQLFEASFIFGMGPIAPFESREICATFTMPQYARIATLSTHMHKRGTLFRLWYPPNEPCASPSGCQPRNDEPEYTNRLYNDPLYQRFNADGGFRLDAADERDRTFLYCAVYDNGATDTTTVKRHSVQPDAGTCEFLENLEDVIGLVPVTVGDLSVQCGCAAEERVCYGGNQGIACGGDDSLCGGGVCDACPLRGGITTEDEMFAILGSWYQADPPAE